METEGRERELLFLALGIGIGAGLMALLDPSRGTRRRALLKDKARATARHAREELSRRSWDFGQRLRGKIYEARGRLSEHGVDDEILLERVRAQLGRPVSHPRALDVEVRDGHVILTGNILRDEIDGLVDRLSHVRGVKAIHSDLEVYDNETAALQHPPRHMRN